MATARHAEAKPPTKISKRAMCKDIADVRIEPRLPFMTV